MKKKSIALMAIAVLMVASIATAYTLAFFTDKTDEKANVFTLGNVKIDLTEDKWKDGQKVTPGTVMAKNPTIVNKGTNDAYVRMTISINHSDVFTDPLTILGQLNKTDWDIVAAPEGIDKDGIHYQNYVCSYKKMLTATGPENTTGALFTDVTIPASFDNVQIGKLFDKKQFAITVSAQAIQADGFEADTANVLTAAQVAFKALDKQGAEKAS